MEQSTELEKELAILGLLGKAREIYSELDGKAALSYIKSSYRLLSKVYHPDLNPNNIDTASRLQQRLNKVNHLLSQIKDEELINLIGKDKKRETRRKKRILVVEDELSLQEIFKDIFLMEGFDVKTAGDGDSGYEVYRQFEPDLIFTDVIMPKMSGLELVNKIRETNPNIKVIYISGFFEFKKLKEKLKQDITTYGYRYLSKPFKSSTMLDLVRDYIGKSGGVNLFI